MGYIGEKRSARRGNNATREEGLTSSASASASASVSEWRSLRWREEWGGVGVVVERRARPRSATVAAARERRRGGGLCAQEEEDLDDARNSDAMITMMRWRGRRVYAGRWVWSVLARVLVTCACERRRAFRSVLLFYLLFSTSGIFFPRVGFGKGFFWQMLFFFPPSPFIRGYLRRNRTRNKVPTR